jgi:hypothetical protein
MKEGKFGEKSRNGPVVALRQDSTYTDESNKQINGLGFTLTESSNFNS